MQLTKIDRGQIRIFFSHNFGAPSCGTVADHKHMSPPPIPAVHMVPRVCVPGWNALDGPYLARPGHSEAAAGLF